MPQVLRALIASGIPNSLVGIDEIIAAVRILVEADVIENEKLSFGAPIAHRRDAGLGKVFFGFAGDVTRIARVRLACDRIEHARRHRQRRHIADRVRRRSGWIEDQEHVALVDGLKAAYARSVEPDTLAEQTLFQFRDRDAKVLPGARQVDELEVDDLQFLGFGVLDHFFRRTEPRRRLVRRDLFQRGQNL